MEKKLNKGIINLLPGPVEINPKVTKAFHKTPVSHRGDVFMADFKKLKSKLCQFVNAKHVEICTGSGTLGNEMIAAQLSQLEGKGLVLVNGEFGERLLSHAERIGLNHEAVIFPWGTPYSFDEIKRRIAENGNIAWIWTVHCETSTGILNDMEGLKALCKERNIKFCIDCISSIATVPVDMKDVYLANGVSGKAFCSYAGLAMVFYNHDLKVSPKIARYLDLGYYRINQGIPFTVSSCLAYALKKAVKALDKQPDMFDNIKHHSRTIRAELERLDFKIMNDISVAAPAVITVELPEYINSVAFGQYMENVNCFISYKSGYLVRRNLIQTYVTRNTTAEHVQGFIELVNNIVESLKEETPALSHAA